MQPPKEIVPFRSAKRPRPWARRVASLAQRLLGTVFGGFLFLCFGGVSWLAVRAPFRFGSLLPLAGMAFIGLFGLNLAVQSVLGRSDQEGFFYAGLARLKRLGAPVVTLSIPALLLLSGMLALFADSAADRVEALGPFVGWLTWLGLIGAHEAGHLLAAQAARLEPIRVIIGPLELRRRGSGWRASLCKEWCSLFGGLVEVRQPWGRIALLEALKFAAGGPLASALLLLLFLYWNPYSLEQLLRIPPDLRGTCFAAGIFFGLLMLVCSLAPTRGGLGGLPSDGHQILAVLRQLRRSPSG